MVNVPVNFAALKAQIIDPSRISTFSPTTAIADVLPGFRPWTVPQCVGLQMVAPCVPIVQEEQLQGLIFPQTVLKLITEDVDLRQTLAREVMTAPPKAIALADLEHPWLGLNRMHQEQQDLLPVQGENGYWLGFVERLSLQRLLWSEPLLQMRQVRDVMVTDLSLMPSHSTLLMAAHRLHQKQQSLLMVMEKASAMTAPSSNGLWAVTLWDVLRGYGKGKEGLTTAIATEGSHDFQRVTPTDSLWLVAAHLVETNSSWAAVVDNEEQLLGKVTWREILQVLDPVALHWQTHSLQQRLHQVARRPQRAIAQVAALEPHPKGLPQRVLLIEGLATESVILQHLLQPPLGSSLTFQVTQVDSLSQAIAQLKTDTYDLIIFDINVVPSGKLEAFMRLQDSAGQRPILLLTDDRQTDIQLAHQCIELGAQDYLLRSLCAGESQTEREILMRSVRYVLETAGAKRSLQQQDQQLQNLNQQLKAEKSAKQAIAQQLKLTDVQMKALFEAITDIVFVINPQTWEIKQVTAPQNNHCGGPLDLCQGTYQFLQAHQARLTPYLQQAIAKGATSDHEPLSGEGVKYEYSLQPDPHLAPVWFVAKIVVINDQQVVWAAHDVTPFKLSQQKLITDQENLTTIIQERTRELKALNATLNTEIQQRKLTEIELRQEQDFLETLFDLTPALFMVLNREGRIIRFNPACEKLTGYQFAEVAQQYLWDLLLWDRHDVAEIVQEFQRLLQQKKPRTYEVAWRAKSGKVHHLRWSHGVLLDKQGNVHYVIATGMDMSDRQAFETTLKTLNQELESRVEQRTRVLEHIEQNLRRQLAAVDAAVDAIAILQREEFISVNPAFLELFDYPHRLSLTGHSWKEVLFAPSEQKRLAKDILPHLNRHKSWQGEAIAQRQNGQTFMQEISLTITSDGDYICVCRDITARNRAALKIRETEALLRSQYRNFPIPTYTWQHRQGNFYLIDYNSAAEIANDGSLQDFLHCPSHVIYGADHAIHQNIHRCFDFKTTFEEELQIPSPEDPEAFQRYFIATYIYIRPDLVMVHTQDLTERKRAERDLQQSQTFLRLVIDNNPNLIFVKDQDGYFSLVNQAMANFYGTTVTELIGKREWDLHPDSEEADCFLQADQQVLREQKTVVIDEAKATDFLGMTRYFRTVKLPLQLPGDRPQYQVLGVASDVTQQRRAKRELEKALTQERELNHLKTRFIDTASHEFRTPLTVILGAAQILSAYHDHLPEERRSQYLTNIEDSVMRLRQLIDDLLTMSRLEAGKLDCQRQAVDIVALCRDLIADLKIGIGKHHHFNLETTGAIASPLALDPNLLQHILNNLLGNACKYSAPGTTVTVQLCSSAAQLTLSIIDQGVGIPPEDQPHIFESFYRASNTQNIPGTGLGLNIVKEYVQLHGGQIDLTSQLGKGSQFTVTIPLVEGCTETAEN